VTAPPAADEPGYAQALDELDHILRELEGTDVDVDRLADRVARATELIARCRERIGAARLRIDEVIADLDGPVAASGGDPDGDADDLP
jgi:exodeoxyribonuclease VII small subunit